MQNPAVLLSEEGASCEPKLQKGYCEIEECPDSKKLPDYSV